MTAKTLSLLAIALSATPAMASGICGSIGKVDVPSYRFKVIAADGSAAPQFNVTGALTTVEGVWEVSHWVRPTTSFRLRSATTAPPANT